MLSYVKIGTGFGVWANRDKALEYLWRGFPVYTDETMAEERTEEDLEAIVEGGKITFTAEEAEG